MAASPSSPASWLANPLAGGTGPIAQLLEQTSPATLGLTLLVAIVLVPVLASFLLGRDIKLPVVNPPGAFEPTIKKQFEFVSRGVHFLTEGRRRFAHKPFLLVSNVGPMAILPVEASTEIRNHPALNFRKAFSENVPRIVRSFGDFRLIDHPNEILQNVIKKHLTKRLNTVTEPLAQETSFAVAKIFGDNSEWTEMLIYPAALELIARLSSRVFLGPALCRNEEWLEITQNFTVTQNLALNIMRIFPYYLRPLVFYLEPNCRKSHASWKRGRDIVEPYVAARRKEREECIAAGREPPVYNDAIAWGEQEAGGHPFLMTDLQLGLSFVAIHTTSDLTAQTLVHLAAVGDEAFQALRDELIQVLPAEGWRKTSLTKLKLLDSTIREAQRFKPPQEVTMVRKSTAAAELPGGVTVPKGHLVAVDNSRRMDPEVFENPEKFNYRRFYDEREKGDGAEHTSQLVSVGPKQLSFGLGKYACPGRFFAANEIKLALAHLIMKYDWQLAEGQKIEASHFGLDAIVHPKSRLLCRRRKAEIDMDALVVESEE